jgi:hypothetical protein
MISRKSWRDVTSSLRHHIDASYFMMSSACEYPGLTSVPQTASLQNLRCFESPQHGVKDPGRRSDEQWLAAKTKAVEVARGQGASAPLCGPFPS